MSSPEGVDSRIKSTVAVLQDLRFRNDITYPDALFSQGRELAVGREVVEAVDGVIAAIREKYNRTIIQALDPDHAEIFNCVLDDERRAGGTLDQDDLAAEFLAQLMFLETLKEKFSLREVKEFDPAACKTACFALTCSGSVVTIGSPEADGQRELTYARMRSRKAVNVKPLLLGKSNKARLMRKGDRCFLPVPDDLGITTSRLERIYVVPENLPPKTSRAITRSASRVLTGAQVDDDLEPVIPALDADDFEPFETIDRSVDFDVRRPGKGLLAKVGDHIIFWWRKF